MYVVGTNGSSVKRTNGVADKDVFLSEQSLAGGVRGQDVGGVGDEGNVLVEDILSILMAKAFSSTGTWSSSSYSFHSAQEW